MGLFNWIGGTTGMGAGKLNAKAIKPILDSRPREMTFRFVGAGQTVWYESDTETLLNNGFLGNHVVFSIVDWIASKLSIAPPILYQVKDEKQHRKYKALLKDPTPESVLRAMDVRRKALVEVDNSDMMDLFSRPNPVMPWAEFVYGYYVYKAICGSSYFGAARDGIDGVTGKIQEMWLFPSHHVTIESGGRTQPISHYLLRSAPDTKIDASNVLQIRNFSPLHQTESQWLYGLSKLYPAKAILQEYNEGTAAKVDMFQKRGIRDIVFPKGDHWSEEAVEAAMSAQDVMNKRMQQSGPGGVIANSVELGSIRVGLSPAELGILESSALTKKDFCALFHVPATIFDWNPEGSTYNNLSESRKIGLTDAVIPELEALKDGLNNWLVPSWYPAERGGGPGRSGGYVLDFDYESYPELQEDMKAKVDWMDRAGCLTVNEKREVLRYEADPSENANKILVKAGQQLLDEVGIGSFEADVETEPDPEQL